ncbi:MAG: manganese efflux pump, partial [Clostridia bacterium]|nr:manganese efflux pump [Clostridia bacterium]
LSCLLIGIVTFFICFAGLTIGKKAGTKLAGKAGILGGVILLFIGLEIFITGIF